jgi:hypothetical protein
MSQDICVCAGKGCPLKDGCQRYIIGIKQSPENIRAWIEEPYDTQKKECSLFYPEG